MKRALTPGTFDPITSGHLDIITRAAALMDEVVVAVASSEKKKPLFDLEKRVELARQFQMTALNYQLDRELETLFIMSPPQHMYLSSSIVREIASMHGDVSRFVPPCVDEALKAVFDAR